MTLRSKAGWLLAALCVAGCSERPQILGASTAKKSDAKAWETAPDAYAAAGWKSGDRPLGTPLNHQAAWEAQLRNRAQGQNEYSRAGLAAQAAPTKAP